MPAEKNRVKNGLSVDSALSLAWAYELLSLCDSTRSCEHPVSSPNSLRWLKKQRRLHIDYKTRSTVSSRTLWTVQTKNAFHSAPAMPSLVLDTSPVSEGSAISGVGKMLVVRASQ